MAKALIFDSGVGGLSVAAEIRKALPELALSYVADDAFRPYGEKSESALQARLPGLLAAFEIMLAPDIIVIACNTASTTALAQIRAGVRAPVVGVVPAIKPAAEQTRTGTIAVLGTPGTVQRRYVDDLIADYAADKTVILQGSVNLVDIAEEKLAGRPVDFARIKAEIASMFYGQSGANIDAVVLACTHFPLLREELRASVNQTVKWIDSGAAIARRVTALLAARGSAEAGTDRLGADTAFLMGPNDKPERARAFADYGFNRVVGLLHEKL